MVHWPRHPTTLRPVAATTRREASPTTACTPVGRRIPAGTSRRRGGVKPVAGTTASSPPEKVVAGVGRTVGKLLAMAEGWWRGRWLGLGLGGGHKDKGFAMEWRTSTRGLLWLYRRADRRRIRRTETHWLARVSFLLVVLVLDWSKARQGRAGQASALHMQTKPKQSKGWWWTDDQPDPGMI